MGELSAGDSRRAIARLWVEESCHAQGLPVKVDDQGVVELVATLLTVGRSISPATDARSG
jgi:hypothetical protein